MIAPPFPDFGTPDPQPCPELVEQDRKLQLVSYRVAMADSGAGEKRLWNTEEPEIEQVGQDRHGNPRFRVLRGGMFDHQRTWWDLPNYVKLLVTGFGGGKSVTLCKRAIALALHNAPAPHALVSPTFAQAQRTLIPTMSGLLHGLERRQPSFRWRYNQTKKEWALSYRHPTRGVLQAIIWLVSGDDPEALRGPNLGSVGIDEPFLQDVEVFTQMNARIRHPAALHEEIGLAGTPESLNWGWELAEGEMGEQHDVGVVQASTAANKLSAGGYLGRMEKQYADKERRAYVYGEFVNLATGVVYYGFDRELNRRHVERPENSRLGAGIDFGSSANYASMAAVVFWTDGHRIHVLAVYEQINSDTPYMAGTLREDWPDLVDVYPDASGNTRHSSSGSSDFQALGERGFDVDAPPGNPDRHERYSRVNALLQEGRITIEPEGPGCAALVQYIGQYSFEKMKKQKKMSHVLDALGYPVCQLFPAVRHEIIDVSIV